jgi:hypothetical protein
VSETHFDDFDYAKRAIALDGYGYDGPSMPTGIPLTTLRG